MHTLKSYPYKHLQKYPGMRPRDVAIWDEYITQHPDHFVEVWYNVHIGDPCEHEHDREEMKNCGAFEVSQWCIDVVARDDEVFYVIEIKPNAMAGAIGQALGYTLLLEDEALVPGRIVPIVITDQISPITGKVGDLMRVAVLIP